MSDTAIGVLLGLTAAIAFESSYVLLTAQVRRARTVARPDASFLVHLARRPWWLAAIGLNGVAFALEVVALRHVSLVVVQPLFAVGLLGLVLASRLVLGEAVGARQFLGALLIAIGVTLVVVGAPNGTVSLSADVWTVLAVIVLVTVLALPQCTSSGRAWTFVAAAAAGDTLVALATNTVAANWPQRLAVALAAVVAVAICGLTAVASESAALQRLPASRVSPIVTGVQTTLPTLLAALLGDQSFSSATGGGKLLALGVVLVGAGALCLGGQASRSRSLRRDEVDERLRGG
jgi:drug/metabolite transporter (DMT)-like permease